MNDIGPFIILIPIAVISFVQAWRLASGRAAPGRMGWSARGITLQSLGFCIWLFGFANSIGDTAGWVLSVGLIAWGFRFERLARLRMGLG